MQQAIQFLIGVLVLILGFPIGNFLAQKTKEELKSGQRWFKLILLVSGIGAIISTILKKDILIFEFLFIFIVTSRSLIKK